MAFNPFPSLAAEIQHAVWRYVSQHPRVITIEDSHEVLAYAEGHLDSTKTITTKTPVPAILHVNHQARTIGLEIYTHIPKRYCGEHFYLNPAVDSILVRGSADLAALWRNQWHWFPELREKQIFGLTEKMPLLIIDPSEGYNTSTAPKDPEKDISQNMAKLTHNANTRGVFTHLLFRFDKVVLLEPARRCSRENRWVYNGFTRLLRAEMYKFISWKEVQHWAFAEELPGWLQDEVGVWSQEKMVKSTEKGHFEEWKEKKGELITMRWKW